MINSASLIAYVIENTVVLKVSKCSITFFVKKNKEVLTIAFSLQTIDVSSRK